MKGVLARLAGAVALAALLGMEVTPISAATCGVVLDVANPSSGAKVPRGRLNIEGVAYDKNATTGTGVDMVSGFIGDRDLGGATAGRPGGYIGSATLGLPNPLAATGQWSKAGFQLRTLSLRKGAYTLYIYARGGNCEAVQTIPIKVDS
jgi:hypothetical protein